MKHIVLFLKGIAIGIANMIAGLSGGTIAYILGIYEEFISALANLTKKFWPNFLYLLKVGIGIVLGIVLAAKVLNIMFARILLETVVFFAALVLGGIFMDRKNLKLEEDEKSKSYKYIIGFILAFLLVIGLTIVNVIVLKNPQTPDDRFIEVGFKEMVILFFSMMLATLAMIFPGISGSLMFMILGVYYPILNAISDLTVFSNYSTEGFILNELLIILPMLLGGVISLLFLSKPIKWVFNKYHKITLYVISGFVIASVIAIFVLNFDGIKESFKIWHLLLSIFVSLPLGFGLSYLLHRFGNKPEIKEEK